MVTIEVSLVTTAHGYWWRAQPFPIQFWVSSWAEQARRGLRSRRIPAPRGEPKESLLSKRAHEDQRAIAFTIAYGYWVGTAFAFQFW